MKDFFSFAQALESKIRSQIEKEIQNSSSHHSNWEKDEDFLFDPSIIPIKMKFSCTFSLTAKAKKAYKVTNRSIHPIRLSETQANALKELNLLGAGLQNPFTKKQLKKVSRKLSLQCHPDHGGTADQFIKIMAWIRALENCAL